MLHETHVCRDCGAEVTMPYVRPDAARTPSQPDLREALLAEFDALPRGVIGRGHERRKAVPVAQAYDILRRALASQPAPAAVREPEEHP